MARMMCCSCGVRRLKTILLACTTVSSDEPLKRGFTRTQQRGRANPADATNNPGNLYILGGCSSSSSAGCTAYSQNVYKCNIQAAGTIASCSTTGQQQIGILPGDTATGLGIMSGTVYANYIYLIGGVSPNLVDLKTVRYAKIDSNNNIVTAGAGGWTESPYQMAVGRRRSAAFGYNGYLYAVGGYEAVSGVLADIEFIKIDVSTGALVSVWVVSAVEINQRWGLTVPISNSYAYVGTGCAAAWASTGCAAANDVSVVAVNVAGTVVEPLILSVP
jgi:hypothetical protein